VSAGADARVHDWRIDERERSRHETRRGRRHAYLALDPHRTALVVVDMVSFFVGENPYCRGVVPNINRLAATVRAAGGVVAWVLPEVPDTPSDWATGFYGPRVAGLYAASGGRGARADRLWPDLDARVVDVWAEKSASSAFFPGRCPLDDRLQALGTLGYRVVMVADGCAAVDDAAHNASLRTIYRSFGDVRPTDEVLGLIAAASAQGPGGDRGRGVPSTRDRSTSKEFS
jgi:nicotinamidase-related amidase